MNDTPQVNLGGGVGTFLSAIWFGMGFHIGWGLISLIVWVAAKALGQPSIPLIP